MVYFNSYFSPFTVHIADMYMHFQPWIDGIIAFAIFFSISMWVYGKVYKGAHDKPSKEAKVIAIAIGAALTFGFIAFEQQSGFSFASPSMQGIMGIIFLCVLGFLLREGFVAMGAGKGCALSYAFVIIFSLFLMPFSPLYSLMVDEFALLASILGIAFLVALGATIGCVGKTLKSMFSDGHGATDHGDTAHPDPHAAPGAHAPPAGAPGAAPPGGPDPNLVRLIGIFEQLGTRYVQLHNDLVRDGDRVLNVNNQVFHGRMTPNDLQVAMRQFLVQMHEMHRILTDLQQCAHHIASGPLNTLTPAQLQQIGSVYGAYGVTSARISHYMNQFQNYYNHNLNSGGRP
jgi:hypothetical protein